MSRPTEQHRSGDALAMPPAAADVRQHAGVGHASVCPASPAGPGGTSDVIIHVEQEALAPSSQELAASALTDLAYRCAHPDLRAGLLSEIAEAIEAAAGTSEHDDGDNANTTGDGGAVQRKHTTKLCEVFTNAVCSVDDRGDASMSFTRSGSLAAGRRAVGVLLEHFARMLFIVAGPAESVPAATNAAAAAYGDEGTRSLNALASVESGTLFGTYGASARSPTPAALLPQPQRRTSRRRVSFAPNFRGFNQSLSTPPNDPMGAVHTADSATSSGAVTPSRQGLSPASRRLGSIAAGGSSRRTSFWGAMHRGSVWSMGGASHRGSPNGSQSQRGSVAVAGGGVSGRRVTLRSTRFTPSATVDEDSVDGTTQINEYVLLYELGRGTQGEVFLAMNTAENEVRAIKAIPRTSCSGGALRAVKQQVKQEQLEREIKILTKCRHAHIVRLYEVIDDPAQDCMYLVMQYVENGPIATIDIAGRVTCSIPPTRLLGLLRQIAGALEYLHGHGVVHRDLKPDNILVGQNGTDVFLADFGVSDLFEGTASQKPAETGVSGTRGTLAFLAPELLDAEGTEHVDGKAVDVWALGVTAYALLFGRLPFDHSADARSYFRAVKHQPIDFSLPVSTEDDAADDQEQDVVKPPAGVTNDGGSALMAGDEDDVTSHDGHDGDAVIGVPSINFDVSVEPPSLERQTTSLPPPARQGTMHPAPPTADARGQMARSPRSPSTLQLSSCDAQCVMSTSRNDVQLTKSGRASSDIIAPRRGETPAMLARNLVCQMLTRDPTQRISAASIQLQLRQAPQV